MYVCMYACLDDVASSLGNNSQQNPLSNYQLFYLAYTLFTIYLHSFLRSLAITANVYHTVPQKPNTKTKYSHKDVVYYIQYIGLRQPTLSPHAPPSSSTSGINPLQGSCL